MRRRCGRRLSLETDNCFPLISLHDSIVSRMSFQRIIDGALVFRAALDTRMDPKDNSRLCHLSAPRGLTHRKE